MKTSQLSRRFWIPAIAVVIAVAGAFAGPSVTGMNERDGDHPTAPECQTGTLIEDPADCTTSPTTPVTTCKVEFNDSQIGPAFNSTNLECEEQLWYQPN
ncbi:hypothetical protein GCM10023091_14240 [Ravibacter arvi]|uniref:Uncharacterized protein n=1 Tax=Ravibacter arvi TaxID=2051041 RepID=A0ABP8LVG9_9BACT